MKRTLDPLSPIRAVVIAFLLPVLANGSVVWAQNQAPQVEAGSQPAIVPGVPLLQMTPPVIQTPGVNDKPVTTSMAVLERGCDAAGHVEFDLSKDYLIPTGVGISIPKDQQKSSPCVIQATITISPGTLPASYSILVDDQSNMTVGTATLALVGATAGAIPPGLAPSTDVIWGVMAQNDCSDAFGRRVAGSFYCIQLKIGNNSGYALQLAGVGFAKTLGALEALHIPSVTIANTSYAATRAVLVRSQAVSWRNVSYNLLVGAGLIMSASTPFFFGTGMSALRARTRFTTITAIVNGPVQQAFNLVVPDPIISQLQNLDNQSFRDNMVIPNNSQIQTVVFVEKQAVTLALNEVQTEIRNQLNTLTGKQNPTPSDTTLLLSYKEIAGLSNDTMQNSTRPKAPWKTFATSNPLLVKLALGNIVIVGDHIQYLDRVQLQGNSQTPTQVGINVTASQTSIAVGVTTQLSATVTNDSTGAGVRWSIPPNSGILIQNSSVTATYQAPASLPNPPDVTITATSVADPTKSATVKITITSSSSQPATPGVPSIGTATAAHGQATVSFTAPTSNGGANITSYTVTASPGGQPLPERPVRLP